MFQESFHKCSGLTQHNERYIFSAQAKKVEVQLHTQTLSCSLSLNVAVSFIPQNMVSGTHTEQGFGASLEYLEKEAIPCLCWESNQGLSVVAGSILFTIL